MVVDKKRLEMILSKAPRFPSPKRELEQYPTSSRVASYLLWTAYLKNDIEGLVVADLGCGTGVLSLGALMMGARDVICVDIDCSALHIAKEWIANHDFSNFEVLCSDVNVINLRSIDTVIMNPPFGVYRRGADILFLKKALELASRSVYSIHKFNIESHNLILKIANDWNFDVELLAIDYMEIPQIYEDHVKRVHRFKIALYRFKKRVR